MNKETPPVMAYPYMERPMWLYSRSSDKRMFVLIQQMRNLLSEANHRGYTVVGTSQDMGTGRSMARMGLKQMMQAVQGGFVRAVPVSYTHLPHNSSSICDLVNTSPLCSTNSFKSSISFGVRSICPSWFHAV